MALTETWSSDTATTACASECSSCIDAVYPGDEDFAAGEATLLVCGLNHTRAGVETRERFALDTGQRRELLLRLRQNGIADQAFALSTCNRTELYVWGRPTELETILRETFVSLGADPSGDAGLPPIYQYQGLEAVRHLFAVIAGLDSMILGENQIKHQLREAHELAREAGTIQGELNQTIEAAFHAGKRIRTETDLNAGTLCVGKAAVLMGERVLGSLRGRICMIIGAGKVGKRAARAIAERQPGRLWIVNRSIEHAREIAEELGGEAYTLADLPCLLGEAELIIGAAYAPEFVLDRAQHHRELTRNARRVCMVDAALPRILDPAFGQLDNVNYFDIGAMQEIVDENHGRRRQAVDPAWQIVEQEVEAWRQARAVASLAPAIRRLTRRIEEIFAQEEPTFDESSEAGRRASRERHRLKQRILHACIQQLKARILQ